MGWSREPSALEEFRSARVRTGLGWTAPDFQQCWVYHTGGAFELGWQIPYAIFMARDSLERQGLNSQLLATLERDLIPAPTPFAQPLSEEAYRRLPLMAWGDLLLPVARYLTDYLHHPEDGPYWWASNVERLHGNINIPMYHVTSWYDIFLHGGLTHYCGLRQRAMTPEARAQQKLLVGPWAHRFPYTGPSSGDTGDIDFGPNARIELHETQLRWFDYYQATQREFFPHARAKKLPRAAECLVYSLTPSGVLAENHPKNRGFVGILRGQKCLKRGQKCPKRRFSRRSPVGEWSRGALDASGFWQGVRRQRL